mgnify:CR=1 FL=1
MGQSARCFGAKSVSFVAAATAPGVCPPQAFSFPFCLFGFCNPAVIFPGRRIELRRRPSLSTIRTSVHLKFGTLSSSFNSSGASTSGATASAQWAALFPNWNLPIPRSDWGSFSQSASCNCTRRGPHSVCPAPSSTAPKHCLGASLHHCISPKHSPASASKQQLHCTPRLCFLRAHHSHFHTDADLRCTVHRTAFAAHSHSTVVKQVPRSGRSCPVTSQPPL